MSAILKWYIFSLIKTAFCMVNLKTLTNTQTNVTLFTHHLRDFLVLILNKHNNLILLNCPSSCCLTHTIIKSYHTLVTQVLQQLFLVNCRMAISYDVRYPYDGVGHMFIQVRIKL